MGKNFFDVTLIVVGNFNSLLSMILGLIQNKLAISCESLSNLLHQWSLDI